MGKSATVFKDIGKACSDLLTKDYKVGKSTVEVKSKTSNGVTFTPSATKTDKNDVSGSLVGKYVFTGGIETELTLLTSGIVEATVEGSPMKDLLATFACARPKPGEKGVLSSAKCTVEYKKESFTAKSVYDCYKGVLACSGTCVYDALTLGCSADYATAKTAFTNFGAACQFVQPDFSVAAKIASNRASTSYTGMYYHKVSGDMQVGSDVVYEAGKNVNLSFGCQYKLDKDTTVKSKVDADGNLFMSYKQKLSPITTMTLAAQIDTCAQVTNHKFGMVLNVTA